MTCYIQVRADEEERWAQLTDKENPSLQGYIKRANNFFNVGDRYR